jgi:acetyl esterase
VLALLARDGGPSICFQVLIYPVTTASPGDLPSHTEFGEGYVLSLKAMRYFSGHYIGASVAAPDFRGAPLLADDLAGLPVTLIEYRGLSHGFINMAATLTSGRLALDQVCSALRRELA